MHKLFISLFFLLCSALCWADEPIALNLEDHLSIDPLLSVIEQPASAPSKLDASLAEHIHYIQNGSNFIGYLPIHRDQQINQSTYLHVKFALEEYIKRGVVFILLRLNTPGGEVFPAMKIAELLQEVDAVHHIPVVAVVNNWALSAGAMLAYSCRYIAVSSTALMGAAEPIVSGGDGKMESAPEKIVSALRAEFASLAKFYGRNPLIAEAMVDKDIILVRRNGEIIQLHSENEIRTQGENPDVLITNRGKLLTLDAEQLLNLQVADFMLPSAAARDVSTEELELGEWPAVQSPLFSYPFFSKIPYGTIIYYTNWKIDFFAFLTNPIVASLLMMGLIFGIYMEISHPGFGLPGITALTCLAFILVSHFAAEAIGWLEVLLVVLGILLLLAEIFVLPGFGLVGALGIVLILFGLIASMLPALRSVHFSWDFKEWSLQTFEFFEKLIYYIAAVILSFVLIALFARFATPRLLKKSRIVLQTDQSGSVAGPDKKSLPSVGAQGEAFTSLRPGGKVLIANQLYDAIAESAYVGRGEKVVVVKIQGNAIIVAKLVL